jgi:hypothetical protein
MAELKATRPVTMEAICLAEIWKYPQNFKYTLPSSFFEIWTAQ